jgi:hypothetical protein
MEILANRLLLALGLALFVCAACLGKKALAADGPLPLSDMKVEITSQGKTAAFRLYDTVAAGEFYDQLPLELDLSNFRDAQWMFYPPEKLNVRPDEAYHDGKKGELSYYAPWGDVFMLYKDFYAGDEMHRLGVGLSGIDGIADMSGRAVVRKLEPQAEKKEEAMRITVKSGKTAVVFELNDSRAAKDLYAQLPLDIEVENYGGIEKIYYPPNKLNTSNTPLVKAARPGTLAYYAPWGDVVMFHGSFGSASGLYELGRAVQGGDLIPSLGGTVRIEAGPAR